MPERVVVAGAGQCGLLAATGLARKGVAVTLVERLPAPGGQEPEPDIDRTLGRDARAAGVEMLLGTLAAKWDGQVVQTLGVRGAQALPARALVVATGTRPATRGELGISGDRFAGIVPGSAAVHLTESGVLLGRHPIVVGGGSLAASCVCVLRHAGAARITVVAPDGVLDEEVRAADELFTGWSVEDALGNPRVSTVILTKNGDRLRLPSDALILAHRRVPMRNVERATEAAPGVVFCHSVADPKSLPDARSVASRAVEEALAAMNRRSATIGAT